MSGASKNRTMVYLKRRVLFALVVFSWLLFKIVDCGLCATYYVSSSVGKDSSSGTSLDSPWKTYGV